MYLLIFDTFIQLVLIFASLFSLIWGVGELAFISNTRKLCHENVFSETLVLAGNHGYKCSHIL